jgi:polyhydroxyalkanoic acid synthase PhaR subunit
MQWYNGTNESWSKAVGDVIGTEAFVAAASRFLDSYTSYAKTSRHLAQEYFSTLQLATRPDIARVAALVVATEDKVDNLEDRLDELTAGSARLVAANQAAVGALDGLERRLVQVQDAQGAQGQVQHRLDQMEQKLVRVEAAVDQIQGTLQRLLVLAEKGAGSGAADANVGAPLVGAQEERKTGTKRTAGGTGPVPPAEGPAT